MKISSGVLMIIAVAGIIAFAAMGVQEMNSQYPDSNMSSSEWDSKYDYSSQLNETMGKLKDKLDYISNNPEAGFFSKLGAGIYAIPYAVIHTPIIIFQSLAYGTSITVNALTGLSIPTSIITLILTGMLIWVIFKLVEMFNRTPV